VFNAAADDLLQPILGPGSLVVKAMIVDVGEIGMGQRVASNFKSERTQVANLRLGEIPGFSQEPDCDVEGGAKSELLQNGRGGEQIGFTTIIESYADGFAIEGLGRVRYIGGAPARCTRSSM